MKGKSLTPKTLIEEQKEREAVIASKGEANNMVAFLLEMDELFVKERKFEELIYGENTKISREIERIYYSDNLDAFNCRFGRYKAKNDALTIEGFIKVENRILNELLSSPFIKQIEPDDSDLVRIEEYLRWLTAYEPNKTIVTKLSQKEIALIYVYNGESITPKNCDSIAKKHGWLAEYSGKKILQAYNKYQISKERRANPLSPRTLSTMIKSIKIVLPLLATDEAKQTALDDLKALGKY